MMGEKSKPSGSSEFFGPKFLRPGIFRAKWRKCKFCPGPDTLTTDCCEVLWASGLTLELKGRCYTCTVLMSPVYVSSLINMAPETFASRDKNHIEKCSVWLACHQFFWGAMSTIWTMSVFTGKLPSGVIDAMLRGISETGSAVWKKRKPCDWAHALWKSSGMSISAMRIHSCL